MGRYDEALADFNRAIELDPGYAWAIASRGADLPADGPLRRGPADFNRAIELDPERRLGHRQPRRDLPADGAL